MSHITEVQRETPIVETCDLCVVGGSCTGVFAAVRAARRGLKVCIVEALGRFGGTATSRLVNVWHSTWDTKGEVQVIGGLTLEVLERLQKRGQVIQRERTNTSWEYCFNSSELTLELDELIVESNIRPFLHARVVAATVHEQEIKAVIIEDKSGRRAIVAKQFIDASGDADLLRFIGVPTVIPNVMQPPTTAALVTGLFDEQSGSAKVNIQESLFGEDGPEILKNNFLWTSPIPGCSNINGVFGTRVHGVDCANADDLTKAEMHGRAQVRAMVDRLREVMGPQIGLVALPCAIGVRDSRRIVGDYCLKGLDVLEGVAFEDAIAHSTYRVDIHQQGGEGLTFRYLDGREIVVKNGKNEYGRWREERDVDPTYYSIPFRSLIPQNIKNVLAAGRCLSADEVAYGAVRVMVTCNQTGEAAGEAVALAHQEPFTDWSHLDVKKLRSRMNEGGSKLQGVN